MSECLQTNFSHISRAHISKRKRGFDMEFFDTLFPCEDEDIGR